MSDFSDDLISDILSRISVKSLLRFRCVSKTWCDLIDNNSFIKQHLNRSIETKTNYTLILEINSDLHSVGLYSLTDKPLKLFQPTNSFTTILGSCNGLLCLLYGIDRNLLMLWNPATRKHVKIPVAKPAFRYGFGYDSVSDDYKFVKVHRSINDVENNSFVSDTSVYSLRSNSWRMIENVTYYLIEGQGLATLACGALHWIGWGKSGSASCLVTAFDLATEEYMMITLPYAPRDGILSMLVSELGGCLSLVCRHRRYDGVDVWVMKDYGVSESWTKLLTLSTLEIVRTIEDVIPLAYSESGDEVLLALNSKKLISYNLEKKTSKIVDIGWVRQCYDPLVCLESLVSLGVKAENDEEQSEESEEEDSSWCSRQVDSDME